MKLLQINFVSIMLLEKLFTKEVNQSLNAKNAG